LTQAHGTLSHDLNTRHSQIQKSLADVLNKQLGEVSLEDLTDLNNEVAKCAAEVKAANKSSDFQVRFHDTETLIQIINSHGVFDNDKEQTAVMPIYNHNYNHNYNYSQNHTHSAQFFISPYPPPYPPTLPPSLPPPLPSPLPSSQPLSLSPSLTPMFSHPNNLSTNCHPTSHLHVISSTVSYPPLNSSSMCQPPTHIPVPLFLQNLVSNSSSQSSPIPIESALSSSTPAETLQGSVQSVKESVLAPVVGLDDQVEKSEQGKVAAPFDTPHIVCSQKEDVISSSVTNLSSTKTVNSPSEQDMSPSRSNSNKTNSDIVPKRVVSKQMFSKSQSPFRKNSSRNLVENRSKLQGPALNGIIKGSKSANIEVEFHQEPALRSSVVRSEACSPEFFAENELTQEEEDMIVKHFYEDSTQMLKPVVVAPVNFSRKSLESSNPFGSMKLTCLPTPEVYKTRSQDTLDAHRTLDTILVSMARPIKSILC